MNAITPVVLDGSDVLGDMTASIGSPAWCSWVRWETLKLLEQTVTDHARLESSMAVVMKYEIWKHVTDIKGKPFPTYAAFCKAAKPYGLGRDAGEIDALIAEGAAKRTAQAMAADESVEPLKGHGGARGQVADSHLKAAANKTSSDSVDRIVRKLKRDFPEIAAALANGEYPSARAAGIAAGIVRVSTPLDTMKRAWRKASEAERQAFSNWIYTEEATK